MSGKTPRYLLLVLVLAVLTCLAALLALDLAAPDTAEGPNGMAYTPFDGHYKRMVK